MSQGPGKDWVHETTFGGKAKDFWWKVDDACNLYITRPMAIHSTTTIPREELDRLDQYMSEGEWKGLANNVEKLHNGTEVPGIGRFLHDELTWPVADALLASHLAVIFSNAGAWSYNGKRRGIELRRIAEDRQETLKRYYTNSTQS